ncbi:aldolase-type TIM barrel family protein [Actinidia rufa]|uniref:Aldolase-type TIM barrel family protein n=1 Tax=Actinidia rufa TaxID=165716 RepID=A0A7J0F1Q4_9ERIC|nr:aldolase-type TIM barrel family protein [Actinidia rufa]
MWCNHRFCLVSKPFYPQFCLVSRPFYPSVVCCLPEPQQYDQIMHVCLCETASATSEPLFGRCICSFRCKDVAAVDINMGCPKSFSISGGMGAALLTKPGLIADILTTLRGNLDTPVTCKIRFLKSSLDTVELAWRIEKTCVSALAVHGRRVADRPRDPANWNGITHVVAALSIPVIENGDVFAYEDIQRIKESIGRLKPFDSAIDVSSVLWYL